MMLYLCCTDGETEAQVTVLPQGEAIGEGTTPLQVDLQGRLPEMPHVPAVSMEGPQSSLGSLPSSCLVGHFRVL